MASFTMLIWDLSPATARSAPPVVPQTPVDDPETLAMFRACLLKTPHEFNCKLRIPSQHKGRAGEFQIELHWVSAGDTCGVGFWNNRDHTVAISVLLNGLESLEDLGRLKRVLAVRGFAMPDRVMRDIDAEARRPLSGTLYYRTWPCGTRGRGRSATSSKAATTGWSAWTFRRMGNCARPAKATPRCVCGMSRPADNCGTLEWVHRTNQATPTPSVSFQAAAYSRPARLTTMWSFGKYRKSSVVESLFPAT
jgi:hypothetical protein